MHFTCPLNQTSGKISIISTSIFDESLLREKPTIIFADLDDTIFTPGTAQGLQFFCSSNWFIMRTQSLQPEMLRTYFDLFTSCANYTTYIPVSNELNNYLKSATKETLVFGLTARLQDTAQGTHKALSSIEFSFSDYSHPFIMGGVIFAGSDVKTGHSNHKGEIVFELINSLSLMESCHVLFIDDNLKNILQVNDTLSNHGITATLIHLNSISQQVFSSYAWDEIEAISNAQQQHYLNYNEFISNLEVIGSHQCFTPHLFYNA